MLRPHRPGDDDQLDSGHRSTFTHRLRGLERSSARKHRIETREHFAEVDLGIHDDPVDLTIGTGNESVETHRCGIHDLAHRHAKSGISVATTGAGVAIVRWFPERRTDCWSYSRHPSRHPPESSRPASIALRRPSAIQKSGYSSTNPAASTVRLRRNFPFALSYR